ncbi:hypothetical protein VM1G_11524 [Cytospora mali]|uniref:Uncharacterized protein n=1 Tax=Cytospora mali TaxID=578113 RepID=A0A194VZ28_CYTMA|nr:hypothetical protein VM1G_11524 [Valsa mali]
MPDAGVIGILGRLDRPEEIIARRTRPRRRQTQNAAKQALRSSASGRAGSSDYLSTLASGTGRSDRTNSKPQRRRGARAPHSPRQRNAHRRLRTKSAAFTSGSLNIRPQPYSRSERERSG